MGGVLCAVSIGLLCPCERLLGVRDILVNFKSINYNYAELWSIHTDFFPNYFLNYFHNYLGSRMGCTVPHGSLRLGSRIGCVPIVTG